MQKLICELCGSNDFTKDDQGFFVCDYCRTNYTPEQAKKMIVEGTVRVDRSAEVVNLLTLAGNALSARNRQEALDYANRALEVSPDSSAAWYLKGTAVGWLSTVQFPRLREMQHAYSLAIQNAVDGERNSTLQQCAERTSEIALSLTETSLAAVRQYPPAWHAHFNLAEEALGAIVTTYRWYPNPASLSTYTSIAYHLFEGIPYLYLRGGQSVRAVHKVVRAHQLQLQERINWAGSQMRLFNPSYVTPQPKLKRS